MKSVLRQGPTSEASAYWTTRGSREVHLSPPVPVTVTQAIVATVLAVVITVGTFWLVRVPVAFLR